MDRENDSVNHILHEIQSSIRHIENSHEAITRLIESRIEHTVEIRHLNAGMERIFDELKKIKGRVGKVETILEISEAARKSSPSNVLFEVMRNYWHVIAIIASVLISIFFGIKT